MIKSRSQLAPGNVAMINCVYGGWIRKMAAGGRLLIALWTLAAASLAKACSSVTVHPGSYLESNLSAVTKSSHGCAEFVLLSGEHLISHKFVMNTDVVLIGHPDNMVSPVVTCTSNISDPSAEFVNRTEDVGFLTFWGSQSVSIDRIAFRGCPLSLQFVEVTQVKIHNCTFTDFTQTPVSLYNTIEANFSWCLFQSNRAGAALTDEPYRLSGGAVSINTDEKLITNMSLNYVFSNCHFLNNSAKSNFRAVDGTVAILEGAPFNDRGGAIALLTFALLHLDFTVSDCIFIDNRAPMFGGAIYATAPLDETSENILIRNNHFSRNYARSGGALQVSLAPTLFIRFVANESSAANTMDAVVGIDSLKIANSWFIENIASFGGGINLLPGSRNRNISNLFEISDSCFFRNNASTVGAAISIASEKVLDLKTLKTPIVFVGNVFEDNACPPGAIVNSYHNSVRFTGDSTFARNVGAALRITTAVCEVNGKVLFRANDGREVGEGALHLRSHAQVRLFPNSQLEFEENRGSLGAAIVAMQPQQQPFLKRVIDSTQCFLLFALKRNDPHQQNFSLSFKKNSAFVGADVFMNNVILCSNIPVHLPNMPYRETMQRSPISFSLNENRGQLNNFTSILDVSTPPRSINILQPNVTTFPGKLFTVNVNAVDEFGQPTAGTFSVEDESHGTQNGDVILPSIKATTPDNTSFTMQLFARQKNFQKTSRNLSFGIEVVANRRVKTLQVDIPRENIPIQVVSCPPGFTATSSVHANLFECHCNDANVHILSCDDLLRVILRDRMWAIHVNTSTDDLPDGLAVYPCPAGYCRCFLLSEEDGPCTQIFTSNDDLDSQCSCHRSGYLCGSCSNGTGVTALLDRCELCSPLNGLLIAALVIVDTIVILGVMMVSLWKPLHLPSSMYPMIFYIQIVSIVTKNYPRPFPVYHSPMFYLGSLLGLYFPYDFCLYPNATAVEVYAIKYIPFILASIICPSVIVAANCRGIKVNYSGVWLILMLLFNQVVYTSASVLNCPMLRDESGSLTSVWFVDGTVKCFTGGHIPLALLAIFCLALCVAAILAPIMLLTYQRCVDLPLRLWVLKEAVAHPYRAGLPYWYLVELMRRALLIGVYMAIRTHSLTHAGPTTLIILYFGMYVYFLPYKERLTNVLELYNLWHLLILVTGVKAPLSDSDILHYFSINRDECGHPVPIANLLSTLLVMIYYGPLVFFLMAMLVKASLFLRAKLTSNSPAKLKRSIRRFTYSFRRGYSWRDRRRSAKVTESIVELVPDSNTVALLPTQLVTFTVIDEESSDSHNVPSSADDFSSGETQSLSISY